MALPSGPVPSFQKGSRLLNGSDVQKLADLIGSVQLIPVATAGGTALNSIQINAAMVEVASVASANDGVVLPLGYPGLLIIVANADASDSLRVFTKGSDVVNAAATQFDVANLKRAMFFCVKKVGAIAQWYTILTA